MALSPDPIGTLATRLLTLPRSSRYRRSLIYKDLGNSYGPWAINRTIALRHDDMHHRVRPGEAERLDILAFKYYQNPYLWWVIALANGIIDPLTQPQVDDVLRIPSLANVLTRLAPD